MHDLRAGRSKRPARFSLCALFLLSAVALPALPAEAAVGRTDVAATAESQSIADFYAARGGQPLWLRDGIDPSQLLEYLRTAEADGLDPSKYQLDALARILGAAWGGSTDKVRAADLALSQAFVAYVRDLKRLPSHSMIWVDADLKPKAPDAREVLEAAASAPSLDDWLTEMGWMNPIYAGLRRALVSGHSGAEPHLLRLNLDRARVLPAGKGRYILVNATAQRLEMYEDGRVVDSMNVVVGKPKNPTPMMAALIRYASLNPYWYVPPDLAAERIAPNVVKEGLTYLKTHGYQVMGNWNDDSTVIDPASIDWQAVADGRKQVWIRQLPGPGNSMGQMKFMFPNDQGIYLHDTPQKELLSEASRMFSGGCVRLEDATRLGQWLFGRPLRAPSHQPEIQVDLPEPVPVYISYFTMMPEGSQLATFPDVYGRDRDELALRGGQLTAGR